MALCWAAAPSGALCNLLQFVCAVAAIQCHSTLQWCNAPAARLTKLISLAAWPGVTPVLFQQHLMILWSAVQRRCVYKGRWRGVLVAVKIVEAPMDSYSADAVRESLLSASISHPNVVVRQETHT